MTSLVFPKAHVGAQVRRKLFQTEENIPSARRPSVVSSFEEAGTLCGLATYQLCSRSLRCSLRAHSGDPQHRHGAEFRCWACCETKAVARSISSAGFALKPWLTRWVSAGQADQRLGLLRVDPQRPLEKVDGLIEVGLGDVRHNVKIAWPRIARSTASGLFGRSRNARRPSTLDQLRRPAGARGEPTKSNSARSPRRLRSPSNRSAQTCAPLSVEINWALTVIFSPRRRTLPSRTRRRTPSSRADLLRVDRLALVSEGCCFGQ